MSWAEFRYVTTNIYQPKYNVTGAVGNGTSITYTAANHTFAVGDSVTTTGILPTQYNKSDALITAVTANTFTITSGSTGTYVAGGSATAPNRIISELPLTGVNYTQQLNSVGTFQGHLLMSGADALTYNAYEGTIPGKTILWVLYTDPINNVSSPVWSGVIWAREYDGNNQTLSISAQEMMSLFNRRRISTTKDYTTNPSDTLGFDPTYIAQQLMQYAESLTHGNIGLGYSIGATAYRTKKKYEGYELKPVYQAIKDLSANFFDFAIKPIGVNNSLKNIFYCDDPLGKTYSDTDLTAAVFQYPGNLVSYKFPEDGSSAVNQLYGLGYGNNTTQYVAIGKDTNRLGSVDPWPLLEDTVNFIDIGELALLKNLTKGQTEAVSYPPTTIEIIVPTYVDPFYPSYNIGQQVRLDVKDDYFPGGLTSLILRIVGISVTPGENGPSHATLTLTRLLQPGIEVS